MRWNGASRCELVGKSMETETTTWSEFPNGGKAIVEQILPSEEINKSKRAGLLPTINVMHSSFFSHVSSSICNKCPWNLSQFQCSISLIGLRPRRSRWSAVGIQSFKDIPQIYLIIPLSALTNRWITSVTTGQVLLPYKSTFLTYVVEPFSLVQTARLERIFNNSRNVFHDETIPVETASE